MGMDVYGRKPTAKEGEYFRNNVWWWRPLADLCQAMAPDVCKACQHWHSNDGDGLDATGAVALGQLLERRIADGTVARYVTERERYLAGLPDETCDLCHGTGIRNDAIGIGHGQPEKLITEPADHPRLGQKGWCNGCDGKGKVRPFATHYPCSVENVAEFAAFCKASGGFDIN